MAGQLAQRFLRARQGEVLADYASDMSTPAIAAKYGVSQHSIRSFARRAGVPSRPCGHLRYRALDESVFDDPTEEGLYWIGFLMADGCISDTGRGSPALVLGVATRDACAVESLRTFLGSDAAVTRTGGGAGVRFAVRSQRLADALARYGIGPRKSLTAEAKGGAESAVAFWRGCVDGDGFLARNKRNGFPRLGLVGSLPLLKQFQAFVRGITDTRATIRPMASIWAYSVSGWHAVAAAKALYADTGYALPRKLALAHSVIRWAEGRVRTDGKFRRSS